MRIATWLELAMLGAAPRISREGKCISVRPIELDSRYPCFAITFDQRWLCDNDGALTVFDSFAAASLFLHLLKIDRFKLGEHYDGDAWALGRDDFRYYRLKGRRLAECKRKCLGMNTLNLPAAGEHQKYTKSKPKWRPAINDQVPFEVRANSYKRPLGCARTNTEFFNRIAEEWSKEWAPSGAHS